MGISFYSLVGFVKRDKTTSEAAIKYFIIGSVSSALMLFGASFLYGISGSTNIYVIMNSIANLTNIDIANPVNAAKRVNKQYKRKRLWT